MTAAVRHLRPVHPIEFPATDPEWEMGQTTRHARLCEMLYQVLKKAVSAADTVGADNFLYFDASDPKRKCAPDGFVKLGVARGAIETWKTWEDGAPELAIEIVSPRERQHEYLPWKEKMRRYHAVGVREIIAFNADAPPGKRLRAWDRIENDLVQRRVEDDTTPCLTLGLHFIVRPATAPGGDAFPAVLRLARDREGVDIVMTEEEALAAEKSALAAEKSALASQKSALASENERLRTELAALSARLARAKKTAAKTAKKR